MEVTDRFKGLDLIDREPEKLRTEVHDIVKEAVTKKCKKAKWLRRLTNSCEKKRSEKQRRKGKI